MELWTVDFETDPIVNGSKHSPRPAGVAVWPPGVEPYYLAWGHPTGNNCAVGKAVSVLRDIFKTRAVLFHNAKFDVRVALEWAGCRYPKQVHDTQFLAYLEDPRRQSIHLKDLAHVELGMPPDEQEELRDWLMANYPPARRAKKNWARYIAQAPGALVGRYAVGDVVRTRKLYDLMMPRIAADAGLLRAYRREINLLPVILHMERSGVPIKPTVHEALDKHEKEFNLIEKRLCRRLGSDINFGHGPSVLKAATARGIVDEDKIEYTTKGNPKAGRDDVAIWCSDTRVVEDLGRRSKLVKVIGTYLRPWAEAEGGIFYPYFNQTRGDYKGGTRTGRLSSNFQQVPRKFEDPTLPFLRNFIWGGGRAIVARDYSQQELRILAHYAEGSLLEAYLANPTMDVHQWVKDLIHKLVGLDLERSPVKQANFLQVYGGGVPALSSNIGCSEADARTMLDAHRKALPEVPALSKAIKAQLQAGIPIRTWGGRLYDVEEGYSKRGILEKLYYKMINILIQGSAADQTKEAMIEAHNVGLDLRIQVHDEILALSDDVRGDMILLREIMNDSTGWDVPMLSDGKVSAASWGEAKPWDDELDEVKQ